jgi:hypothetical protein
VTGGLRQKEANFSETGDLVSGFMDTGEAVRLRRRLKRTAAKAVAVRKVPVAPEVRPGHPRGTLAPLHPGTLAPLHPCTLAPWHPCTLAALHPGTLAPLQPCTLAPLHPCTLAPLHPWTIAP